jgi:maleate isomerase
VEFHFTRNRIAVDRSVIDMLPGILESASLLANCRCDLIVYHCTGRSMAAGKAAETRMVDAITQATGRAATSTAAAIIASLRALEARRIVLATPYQQGINDLEKQFLMESGIEVLRDSALDLSMPEGMCGATPDFWIEKVLELRDAQADAYFISCTNIQSLDAIEKLEIELGRPVITSNQAALWHALRSCGISDAIPGLGRLLRLAAPPSTPVISNCLPGDAIRRAGVSA